jgi:hypothetical protein
MVTVFDDLASTVTLLLLFAFRAYA